LEHMRNMRDRIIAYNWHA